MNLHGCKVRTSYKIVVGMLVNLECPKAGTSGKGVCIRVWDPTPGVAGHEIAIQLIKPQNLWGVTNPPADWEVVAKSMVQKERPKLNGQRRPAPVAAQHGPTEPFPSTRATSLPPPPAPAAPVRPAVRAGPTVDQRLAELERRSTQLVESVLDIMRGQAEELTRNSLEEFRQQVDALIQDSEVRMRQGLMQAYEESAASLTNLRTDLMEQITARGAQIVRSTEDNSARAAAKPVGRGGSGRFRQTAGARYEKVMMPSSRFPTPLAIMPPSLPRQGRAANTSGPKVWRPRARILRGHVAREV